ncbi:NAD/NADP transhydrogenase alpha subunit [Paenibacillus sp. KN14-4R]|uniref:NAD/NADP transhydrogenase alpha subunit n=1 Tax=Paenibacillus sp. KN14-4R TaxID=3445773 RepID=UPI003F9F0860
MKCISVYTADFEAFSDIFDQVLETKLADNEEVEIDGIVVSEAGEVPDNYIERMRAKLECVVMKHKESNATILQHGNVFEIIIPKAEAVTA